MSFKQHALVKAVVIALTMLVGRDVAEMATRILSLYLLLRAPVDPEFGDCELEVARGERD